MACPCILPSCHGEKSSLPQSSQDLDPDKPRCITSCWGDETNLTFLHTFFWTLVPNFQLLQLTLESVIGSAPVEHPHKGLVL